MDDDKDDEDRLPVEDVVEHLVPVHGNQGGVSDMNHMIKVTGEDLVKVKCDRIKKLLNMLRIDVAGDAHYENIVHELIVLVNKYCTGIPLVEDKLRNQLRMLERSPAKKTLLTEISLLTGEVSDELYRVREIFTNGLKKNCLEYEVS